MTDRFIARFNPNDQRWFIYDTQLDMFDPFSHDGMPDDLNDEGERDWIAAQAARMSATEPAALVVIADPHPLRPCVAAMYSALSILRDGGIIRAQSEWDRGMGMLADYARAHSDNVAIRAHGRALRKAWGAASTGGADAVKRCVDALNDDLL